MWQHLNLKNCGTVTISVSIGPTDGCGRCGCGRAAEQNSLKTGELRASRQEDHIISAPAPRCSAAPRRAPLLRGAVLRRTDAAPLLPRQRRSALPPRRSADPRRSASAPLRFRADPRRQSAPRHRPDLVLLLALLRGARSEARRGGARLVASSACVVAQRCRRSLTLSKFFGMNSTLAMTSSKLFDGVSSSKSSLLLSLSLSCRDGKAGRRAGVRV